LELIGAKFRQSHKVSLDAMDAMFARPRSNPTIAMTSMTRSPRPALISDFVPSISNERPVDNCPLRQRQPGRGVFVP